MRSIFELTDEEKEDVKTLKEAGRLIFKLEEKNEEGTYGREILFGARCKLGDYEHMIRKRKSHE